MSEWKEYSLEEITEPIKETYIPTGNDSLPYIGLEHIEQESLRLNGIGKSSDVTSNKFKFKQDDVLFGKLRPYFRKVIKPKFNGICSTDIWVLRAKENINQDFLFYFIANWDFVNLSNGGEGGTRMPRADWNFLKQTRWKISSIKDQIAIASVLSSLDDKIDLLHRQNATLEKIAETLFRKWFVEEAKEDWEMGKITNYALHFKDSIHPQKNQTALYSHYSIPAFDNGKNPINELGQEIQSNKYRVPEYCILFSKLNPHKDKRLWLLQNEVNTNAICSTEFQVVLPKRKEYLYFLYGWLSLKENYNEIASGVGGTSGSHQRIDPNTIYDFQCPLITESLLENFNTQIEPLFQKQLINHTQIRTLTALRDTLLPKLMSGEVRVEM
jgi:type I restriction enzyme S subunit